MTQRVLLTAAQVSAHIQRLATEIVQDVWGEEGKNTQAVPVVLLGIQTRGVVLARRLAEHLQAMQGGTVPVGSLDITLYRDDVNAIDRQPIVKETEIPVPVDGCPVILVDDVLYTGRTVRSALNAIMDFGRPRWIRLAVLVDRGLRELPIQADYVGRRVRTTPRDQIEVRVREIDGEDLVVARGTTSGAHRSRVPHAAQE